MNTVSFLKRLAGLLLFVLLQVLVFGRINLFGYAVPLFYVWMIIGFDSQMTRNAVLIWSFVIGMSVDVFSATPGLNAASSTLVGLLQPFLLGISVRIDKHYTMRPKSSTMGTGPFALYAFLLVFIHNIAYFVLRNIPTDDLGTLVIQILSSTLLTFTIIFCLDLSFSKPESRSYTSNL